MEYEEINVEESESRYAKNKYDARANIFDAKMRDVQIQREDAKEATKQNAKAAENEFWGSKLGSWGSVGLALMLGVANPFALAAIAATGSYAGGSKGAKNVGGYAEVDDIRETTFFKNDNNNMRDGVLEANKGVESSRLMSAGSDAFSVYNLAGGPIPGTSSWTGKETLAASAGKELTTDKAIEGLTEKYIADGMVADHASSLASETVQKELISQSVDGILPDLVDIAELAGDVDDISNLEVILENLKNPNKKGAIFNGAASKNSLYSLLGEGRDFLNRPIDEDEVV